MLLYTIVLDKVVLMGHSKIQVKILSEKSDEIRQLILKVLDRGCTLLHAQTGYTQTERDMLLTVVTNRELAKLNHLVLETDPSLHRHQLGERGARPGLHPSENLQMTARCAEFAAPARGVYRENGE